MEKKNVIEWGNRGEEEEFERLNKITPRVLGGYEKQPLMVDAARNSEKQKEAAKKTLSSIDPEIRNTGIRNSEKHRKASSENLKKSREKFPDSEGWKKYKESDQFKQMQIENGFKSGQIKREESLKIQKDLYDILPPVFTLSEARDIAYSSIKSFRQYLRNADLYEKIGHGKYRKK
jgi:hypothetical protein